MNIYDETVRQLQQFARPIEVDPKKNMTSFRLRLRIFSCYDNIFGIPYTDEKRADRSRYTKDIMQFLESKGVVFNKGVAQGIGEVPRKLI